MLHACDRHCFVFRERFEGDGIPDLTMIENFKLFSSVACHLSCPPPPFLRRLVSLGDDCPAMLLGKESKRQRKLG
jgi:hypothetical protein